MSEAKHTTGKWSEVEQALGQSKFVIAARILPKGHLCITTALTYPDGGNIGVFVRSDELARQDGLLSLTDFGNTATWLDHLGICLWDDPVYAALADLILGDTRVSRSADMLEMNDLAKADLGQGLIEFAQCCLRVADLGQLRAEDKRRAGPISAQGKSSTLLTPRK